MCAYGEALSIPKGLRLDPLIKRGGGTLWNPQPRLRESLYQNCVPEDTVVELEDRCSYTTKVSLDKSKDVNLLWLISKRLCFAFQINLN